MQIKILIDLLRKKINIDRMTMNYVLYAQVVKTIRKDLKFITENKNKIEAKIKFQGRSEKSQLWFDLDCYWIEVNFCTSELDFFKKLLQIHEDTQDTNTFKFFQVPIGNSKCMQNFKIYNDAPMLKYCQKSLNICCFSSLASSFAIIEQTKAVNAIQLRI